jgi:hypothetical protein
MGSAIAELNRQFEIPGTARVVEGNGKLPKAPRPLMARKPSI